MKYLLLLLLCLPLQAEEVESDLKVLYSKTFTKQEIVLCGYNPDVTLGIKQVIVLLPTRERILYTTFTYTIASVNTLLLSPNSPISYVQAGTVSGSNTVYHTTTATKL